MKFNVIGKSRMLAITLMSVMVLSGCGAASTSGAVSSDSYAMDSGSDSYNTEAYSADGGNSIGAMNSKSAMADESGNSTESTTVTDSSKKLITTVNINAETEDMDSLLESIDKEVASLGGYIESSSVSDNSDDVQDAVTYTSDRDYSYTTRSKNAYLTLRIPADTLEGFLSTLSKDCNVTSENKNIEDVTLQYVDTKSHMEALEAELKQLNSIMEKAETVEEIITVEDKITDVQYQLDSIKSQLKVYDNQINYSTVNVSLDEVKTYSVQSSGSIWSEITQGFVRSLKSVGNGIISFLIWFVIHIPQLVIIGIIVFLLVLIIRKKRRNKKTRAAMKAPAEAMKKADVTDTGSENVKGKE